MRYLILILLTMSCCGTSGNPQDFFEDLVYPKYKKYGVDKELKPYYKTFNTVYETDTWYIPAYFGDTAESTAGHCSVYWDGYKEIVINKKVWDTYNTTERELVIFHELGHCHLGRRHDTRMISKGGWNDIPKSVMYPNIMWFVPYRQLRDYYREELEYGPYVK